MNVKISELQSNMKVFVHIGNYNQTIIHDHLKNGYFTSMLEDREKKLCL